MQLLARSQRKTLLVNAASFAQIAKPIFNLCGELQLISLSYGKQQLNACDPADRLQGCQCKQRSTTDRKFTGALSIHVFRSVSQSVRIVQEVLTKVPSNQLYQFLEPQDECGWTPLMVASAKGHTAAAQEVQARLSVTQLLCNQQSCIVSVRDVNP